MSELPPSIVLNYPPKGFAWWRLGQWLLIFILFCSISVVAISSALGFRWNLAAGTIQQTGLIEVDGPLEKTPMTIYVNDVISGSELPFRQNWVFPGYYTVRVTRPGYQDWEESFTVTANLRSAFEDILMLYTTPEAVNVPTIGSNDLTPANQDRDGISIENNNEIWIDGNFLTRLSQPVIDPQWVRGKKHLAYQMGSTIYILDMQANLTQAAFQLPTSNPVDYTFRDNGRILVYQNGDHPSAVALYEPVSFIDRLVGGR